MAPAMQVLLKYDSKNQKKDPNAKALNDTEVVQHAAEIGDEDCSSRTAE